jgi:response regulator RpfG family c-di-GMP phosphodiesterase
MSSIIKILYIDNEFCNLAAFKAHFRTKKKYEIFLCDTETDLYQIIKENKIHILLVSQRGYHKNIFKLLEQLEIHIPSALKIIITAELNNFELEELYHQQKIFNYFFKPIDYNELEKCIEKASEHFKNSMKDL